jgi:hypothetical protein
MLVMSNLKEDASTFDCAINSVRSTVITNLLFKSNDDNCSKKYSRFIFIFLNGILNLITTFALSISIYLLMANLFLLIHKLQINVFPTPISNCLSDFKDCDDTEINYHNINNKINFMKQLYTNEPRKVDTPLFIY